MHQSKKFLLSSLFLIGALGSALSAGCGAVADAGQDAASHRLLQTIAQGDPFGVVTSTPAGIQCATQCAYLFAVGTQVTLVAAPDAGWDFGGWQGACTGSDLTCTVTLSESKDVYFTFRRHPVNDAPPVAVDDTATVAEDSLATAINVLANDTDSDGGAKVITAVSQPTNGTVVITGNGAGVTYAPKANYNGSDTFTYTLNGGAMATVTVTVTAVDDLPIAVNDTIKVPGFSIPNTVSVLANDTDIDGGPKLVMAVSQAAHGTVLILEGGTGVSYTPNGDYAGTDTFTYTLNGGSTAQVTVTVDPIIVATATAPR